MYRLNNIQLQLLNYDQIIWQTDYHYDHYYKYYYLK